MSEGVDIGEFTSAVTVSGPGELRLDQRQLGSLPAGSVRIRLRAGGICGSDMHYFSQARNGDFAIVEPLTLGHEIAGEIAAIGAGVHGLEVGNHVAVNPSRHCRKCSQCQSGAINLCDNGFFMGSASRLPHMQGGFASLFDVEAEQCIVVPAEIPFETVALAEPLAVCLHALARAPSPAGARIAILGCGPIGLLTAMAARQRGASEVYLFDIIPWPLERAAALGFSTILLTADGPAHFQANHFDIVFEAAGSPTALATALAIVRRGGTIVQIGNMSGSAQPVPINLVMGKEVDLHGSFRFGATFVEAVNLITSNVLDVRALISSRYPLREAAAAFAAALDRRTSMKVMLTSY